MSTYPLPKFLCSGVGPKGRAGSTSEWTSCMRWARSEASTQTLSANQVSQSTAKCGPCCSVQPTGRITIHPFEAAFFISSNVISPYFISLCFTLLEAALNADHSIFPQKRHGIGIYVGSVTESKCLVRPFNREPKFLVEMDSPGVVSVHM